MTDSKTTRIGIALPTLPHGWLLASITVRRDEAWCYSGRGPLTYDALIERGDSMEATGFGPTPAAAVACAMEAIKHDPIPQTTRRRQPWSQLEQSVVEAAWVLYADGHPMFRGREIAALVRRPVGQVWAIIAAGNRAGRLKRDRTKSRKVSA